MIKSSCAESSPRNLKVGPSTEARGARFGARRCGFLRGRTAALIGIHHFAISIVRFFEPGHRYAALPEVLTMRAGAVSCLTWAWPDFLPSISMLPLKLAPSTMLTVGAKM